jgi:hypothetical protein
MIIEAKINFPIFRKLMFKFTYSKTLFKLTYLMGLLILTCYTLSFIGICTLFENPPIILVFIGTSIVFFVPIFLISNSKRYYYKTKKLQETIIYEFTFDKLYVKGESFSFEKYWRDIYKIVEFDEIIIIFTKKDEANIIPKKSFKNCYNDFIEILQNNQITIHSEF